uniref:chitin synthase n=1 Tax=Platynereis dumerilii TaxID=6359 RepID=A0A023PPQ8_PLADU|nr:chitin synthase [Platynereis dumerilii]
MAYNHQRSRSGAIDQESLLAPSDTSSSASSLSLGASHSNFHHRHPELPIGHPSMYLGGPQDNPYHQGLPAEVRMLNPERNPEVAGLFPVDSTYTSAEERVRRLYQKADIAEQENLTERSMLDTIQQRFNENTIYTYVSEALLVVNPYKDIPLYSNREHEAHRGQLSRYDREPHIFYIADKAYQRMLSNRMDQCVLVSGESGAGKTETTKHLISHLTYIANQRNTNQRSHMGDLTERITRTNPITEAFGNAETVMNKNSSRFGKMAEINFSPSGDLVGAQILDYLLEKTRVVQQNEGERNFHIFYYLFAGMPRDKLRSYHLEKPNNHSIMATGSDGEIFAGQNGKSRCAQKFQELQAAFRHIGFSEEELDQVYRCLAAILFITDVTFTPDTDGNDPYSERIVPAEDYPLEAISELLGVNKQKLLEAFVSSERITNGEQVVNFHSETRAVDTRDSLAKTLYSLLFGWIIKYINNHLKMNSSMPSDCKNVGILDFSGFENFRYNNFEQLCINMANEQLQCFFLRQMCLEEQEQYLNEGIRWQPIEVPYNEDRLRMFLDRPTGLLELLNDGSRQPNYNDRDFVNSLANHLREGTNYGRYFDRDPRSQSGFCIRHYAADVYYDAEGFLEKNRDHLSSTLRNVMMESENEFIQDLFSAEISETGCLSRTKSMIRKGSARARSSNLIRSAGNTASRLGQRRRAGSETSSRSDTGRRSQPTIATFFRASLHEMLTKLKKAEPFFVRCIKPNNQQSPNDFDPETVLNQLRYTGVMQIAEIRQKGHPVRILFSDFVKRYRLAVHPLKPMRADVQSCQEILRTVATPADFICGRTKVFMKDYVADRLNQRVERNAALILQNGMRRMVRRIRMRGRQNSRPRVKQQSTEPLPGGNEVTVRFGPKKDMSIQVDEEDISQYEELPPAPPKSPVEEDSSDDDVNTAKMPWDIAADIDIEPMSPEEEFRGVMKFLRILMYFVIFLLVLGSATISQLCLLMLTAGVGINSDANNIQTGVDYNDAILNESAKDARWKRAVLQLLAIICVPRVLTFIFSLVKSWFGHMPWPTTRLFLFVMLIETLQTIGETLLVIRVLPRFGTIMSLCMLFSVGLVPSMLKMIFWASPEQQRAIDRKGRDRQRRRTLRGQKTAIPRRCLDSPAVKVMDKFFTFIAFLAQGAGIGFPILVLLYQWNPYWIKGMESTIYNTPTDAWMYWEIPTAMVLTSLKWWENFVHRNRGPFKLARIKQQLFACRHKLTAITSAWSIFVCIAFYYILEAARGNHSLFKGSLGEILVGNQTYSSLQNTNTNNNMTMMSGNNTEESKPVSESDYYILSVVPGMLQIAFACVCYYFCTLASKLMMQKISFVAPLYLSIAASATIIILQCHGILPPFPKETADYVGFTWLCDYSCATCPKDGVLSAWAIVAISAAWVVSLLYLAVHVWRFNNEKMAMRERLFVTPFYVGPLIVPSMLMNRRSLDQELRLDLNGMDLEFRSFDSYLGKEGIEEANIDTGRHKKTDEDEKPVPKIYACATMWHETEQEMKQLLKSIFRMDMDQCARRIALKKFGVGKSDYYEFETQIFFDDAWQENSNKKGIFSPNTWVKMFLSVINQAASAVYETEVELQPPVKYPTAYGGRLVWQLPGGNNLVVHMKDKNKIRHKKRWSQVMYMYYLLGWKLLGNDTQKLVQESVKEDKLKRRRKKDRKEAESKSEVAGIAQGKLINRINDQRGKFIADGVFATGLTFQDIERQVLRKAENTFVLALDGDVDFRPEAVLLLVDRLKRNPKTGAACGRIHPIGSGPMVWYQIFEYAIGHWMQKASEHVFGCVLCSPGCFSLFRGSTLMDTNVMARYTTKSTEASHFVQYDQGEDRWLCTLIIQQGYRVDYCAGADALTFAPEGFREFFNQRRRWVTSTLANQMDLMSSYKTTVYMNDNISTPFMMYQFLLTVSTVLGPSTIILAIASAFKEILVIHVFWSYFLAILPIAFFILICHVRKEKEQLVVAGILSAVYAGIMVVVLVGILKSFRNESILTPSLLFIAILALCFIIGGLLHPYEFFCLAPGVLYYLCIPAGYLILIIYSFSNVNVVSWGTRETPKPASQVQEPVKEEKKKPSRILQYFNLDQYYKDFKNTIMQAFSSKDTNKLQEQQIELLQQLNKNIKKVNKTLKGANVESEDEEKKTEEQMTVIKYPTKSRKPKQKEPEAQEVFVDDPMRPEWCMTDVPDGPISYLPRDEAEFWDEFIKKYVKPLKDSGAAKARLTAQLLELRNNLSFGVWFINGLWVVFNYMMDVSLTPITIGSYETPPLGFSFLAMFFMLLILQLVGMIIHRWGTFLQLIANTELPNPWRRTHKHFETQTVEEAIRITKEMQRRRTFLDDSEANLTQDIAQPGLKSDFKSFMQRTLRGRRGQTRGWSQNLRKSSRQIHFDDYGDDDIPRQNERASRFPYNTVSRGVALSMKKQQQKLRDRTSKSFYAGMPVTQQDSGGPPLPQRFLRPDELERRFDKRFRTLSRRYPDFPFPAPAPQNMDIEVIEI